MCVRSIIKGKSLKADRKLKAADTYGGTKWSFYKTTGQKAAVVVQVKSRNGEWMEWMSLTEKLELICSLTRNRTGAQAQGRRVKDRVWCAKVWTTSLFSPLVASEGMMIYTAFPGPTGHTASWSAVDTQSKQVSLHALPGNLDLESSKTKLSCEVLTERSGRWKMKPGARGWVG